MSQLLSQVQRQTLRQEQRLTPQLIQSLDILQLGALELEERLAQELDANPALEQMPDDEHDGGAEEPAPVGGARDADGPTFERLDELVREYGWNGDELDYGGARSRAALSEASDNKLEAMSNAAARPVSLRDALLAQWNLVEADARLHALGVAIIDALDDAGRLPALEGLGSELEPAATADELERALERVQQLEPPGVAARSVQECLLLQLDAAGEEEDVALARLIVAEHFEDLRKNRLPQIAEALRLSVEDVKQALTVIGRLSLHPGLEETESAAPPIAPDVIVDWDAETQRYDVRLARAAQRELRISPEFREALQEARGDKQTRDFLRSKIEAAAAIIDAVRFRRERLLEVSRAVVEAQRDFLDHGERHIKVLLMQDLAARFGCDPSTISRAVDDKWVQTPRGIYPLRRFFTGGTASESGEVLGWDSIKAKVQEIVDGEDKRSPLSDDDVVSALERQGIDIKRRTVAKYRAQLGIPTARHRRRY